MMLKKRFKQQAQCFCLLLHKSAGFQQDPTGDGRSWLAVLLPGSSTLLV